MVSITAMRGQGKAWGSRKELLTVLGWKKHTSFLLRVHPTARGLGRVGESMVIWWSSNVSPHWLSVGSVGTLST